MSLLPGVRTPLVLVHIPPPVRPSRPENRKDLSLFGGRHLLLEGREKRFKAKSQNFGRASTMAHWVKLSFGCQRLVWELVKALLFHFPSDTPGEAVEDGQSTQLPMCETRVKLLAPSFDLSYPQYCFWSMNQPARSISNK